MLRIPTPVIQARIPWPGGLLSGLRRVLDSHHSPYKPPVAPLYIGPRLLTAFHSTLAPSHMIVRNQPARVGAMWFLQPDLHPTHRLSWCLMESHRGHTRFFCRSSLRVQHLHESSKHRVMVDLRFHRCHLSVVLSQGHGTPQGAAA